MHARIMAVALASCLLTGNVAVAQTPEIQKEVQNKLGELKKERAKLEDLLTLALKNNADIRVAESKLRDAEMSLYRTRMQVLEKVAMLSHEIASARAVADEAMSRYQRDKAAYDKGGLSVTELSASAAQMQKFKSDLARVEAQMEFLTGRHNHKDAVEKGLLWLLSQQNAAPNLNAPPDVPPSAIPEAMGDKIRKALDKPFKGLAGQRKLSLADVIQMLRDHVKGVNILNDVKNPDSTVAVELDEAIPLSACFQWAEDRFGCRFIIRDYGIVAVERDRIPPGAVLLLDFLRNDAAAAA